MNDLLTDLKRHPTNDALIRVDTSLFGMEESSMRRPRRTYPPAFRRQLIELVHAGRSPESLAKEFEPSAQTIRNWARQAARDGGQRTDGLTTPERQELTRLRRELRQVKLEREILSKATAWFARETGTIPAASPRSTGS